MPALYVIHEAQPNAFATGRNPQHAAVAVNTGLLEMLSEEEAAGVIAHELAHIKNRDTLLMSIAATIGGSLSMLAEMAFWGSLFGESEGEEGSPAGGLLGIIFAPIAALLVQMAISRSREYAADATGARYCGNPHSLAGALRKLEMANKQLPMHQVNEATAHMFIVSPLSGKKLAALFSTHPPMEERIRRLEGMQL